MKRLLSEMRKTVENELLRAQTGYGVHYHSPHEGYGVLTEEMFEANQEVAKLTKTAQMLLHDLHENNDQDMIDCLDVIEEYATLAACEYVQVAAVSRKMRESLEVNT
jgi:hypothetical protein